MPRFKLVNTLTPQQVAALAKASRKVRPSRAQRVEFAALVHARKKLRVA